jgi:glycosyltransferase involved in cell wall biosynthesis
LAILGEGRLRAALKAQAHTLGIDNFVHFQGFVANPFPWYRAALALIHPARFEGLPNVVLEAMSVGLPVAVSSAQAGLRDFVRDGESGLVVAADEPAAFAAAMSALATDAALRNRLAAAGREAVEPCEADRAIRSWSEALGLELSA